MSWCDVFSPCITIHPLEVDVTSGGFFLWTRSSFPYLPVDIINPYKLTNWLDIMLDLEQSVVYN